MCSIYGAIGKNYRNIDQIFSKELYHRGPDDRGVFYDGLSNIALGHTRLSIIDLSNHAHQPMSDEANNFVLVFNGEIYNYQEIKRELKKLGHVFSTNSDTEVVLKSYIQWREGCVKHFRGMFAFCIYDKLNEKLFLARDRFGIKPLIYSFLDDQFVFSSELKPLLKSSFIPKKLHIDSLNDYFRYGFIKQPKTIIDGVYYLMPGHSMTVNFNKIYEINKYYDLLKEFHLQPKIDNYDQAVKKVRENLEIATQYHMVSDVDVGAFLSGGVDSSAVVALMKQYSDKQINTFTLGFKHKTNVGDETNIATRTAKYFGCNHRNIKIDDEYIINVFDDFISSIDQPSMDGINTYIISLETAKEMKVALSGLGGDELFAGYPHFKMISECSQKNQNLVSFIGKKLNSLRPNRFTRKYELIGVREEILLDEQRSINKTLDEILINVSNEDKVEFHKDLSSIQKISKSEIDNYLLSSLLRDNDVLSMAYSLEVRPVLLDHGLLELGFSLSDNFKVRNGMLKAIFVDSVKDIIPREVWQRKKTGFEMPLVEWMNDGLNERFKAIINSKKAKSLLTDKYLLLLKERLRAKKVKRADWMSLIFLSWIDRYDIEIN